MNYCLIQIQIIFIVLALKIPKKRYYLKKEEEQKVLTIIKISEIQKDIKLINFYYQF